MKPETNKLSMRLPGTHITY